MIRAMVATLGTLIALATGALLVANVVLSRHPRTVREETTVFENEAVRVERISVTDRMGSTYVRHGVVYVIEDHFIHASADSGRSYETVGRIPKVDPTPLERLEDWVARWPVVRYLRRLPGPESMVVLDSGSKVVFYDRIYRSGPEAEFEPVFEYPRGIGPFPSPQSVAVGSGDTIYFGEYDVSPRPHPIHIYRGFRDGRDWEIAHTFEPGEIFHVHTIQYDSVRAGYWVATGDRNGEVELLFTDDHFTSLDTVAIGDQDWRIVSMITTPDALYWGSDDDRTGGKIFRYDTSTGEKEFLEETVTPSYFSQRLADGTYVITTVYEPTSSVTEALDPPAEATVWISRTGREWIPVLRFEAEDAIGPHGPVRAQAGLPGGEPPPGGSLLVTPRFTTTAEMTLRRYRIVWKDLP